MSATILPFPARDSAHPRASSSSVAASESANSVEKTSEKTVREEPKAAQASPLSPAQPARSLDELGNLLLKELKTSTGGSKARALLREHPQLAQWRPASRNVLMLATLSNQHQHFAMLLRLTRVSIDETDRLGLTALMMAAEQRAPGAQSLRVLLALGADVHHRDPRGHTALMLAAQFSDEQVHDLLEVGSNIDAQNDQGRTALMLAIQTGNSPAVERLRHGSNPSVRDTQGWCAADWAFEALMSQRETLADLGFWGDGLEASCVDWFAPQWSIEQCKKVLERQDAKQVPLCAARVERDALKQALRVISPDREGSSSDSEALPPAQTTGGGKGPKKRL